MVSFFVLSIGIWILMHLRLAEQVHGFTLLHDRTQKHQKLVVVPISIRSKHLNTTSDLLLYLKDLS